MSVLLVALDGALTALAGACMLGTVRVALTPLERVLASIVAGIIVCSAVTYGLALLFGLTAVTVMAAPLVTGGAALLVARVTQGALPVAAWRDAWTRTRASWARRPPYATLVFGVVTAVAVALIFGHAMYTTAGSLAAGYENVWADWSQHLTTESSFAVASNLPSVNPLFSGSALLYPFLGDFHSATLAVLGLSPQASLALPGAVLMTVIALLVVCLAQRLGLPAGAGMVAVCICVFGGGLGFVGVFADACRAHGFSAAQCTLQHVITDPGDGIRVIAGTLHDVPGIIAAQPRAYDGDLTAAALQPLPNMQWYTPLFAWWLPQRTLLYGFAAVLCIVLLVLAADPGRRAHRSAFILAGLLLGLMPLVHVQSLLVAGLVVLALMLRTRRREWLALLAVAIPVALPRLVQIALSPHGAAADGNAYPWLEPGWMSNAPGIGATQASGASAVLTWIAQVVRPGWWGFWFVNLGVAVPLCASVLVLCAVRGTRTRASALASRLTAFMTRRLLALLLITTGIFALANLVIVQSWDWDNTKLFVYWYLMVGLVAGALVTYAWRSRVLRGLLALVPLSMVLTGVIVTLRLLPWTPAADSLAGPYVVASPDEQLLAQEVAQRTPQHAVFLTLGRPNDPVLTLAGRTAVMGYYGWLWSYGVAFHTRPDDERLMFAGCSSATDCSIRALLREYGVDYAEIDDRGTDPGAITSSIDTSWWASQGFPVVARSAHITVYDVRGA